MAKDLRGFLEPPRDAAKNKETQATAPLAHRRGMTSPGEPRVFQVRSGFVCGLCGVVHKNLENAFDCLGRCTVQLRLRSPAGPSHFGSQAHFACTACGRGFANCDDAEQCFERCMHKLKPTKEFETALRRVQVKYAQRLSSHGVRQLERIDPLREHTKMLETLTKEQEALKNPESASPRTDQQTPVSSAETKSQLQETSSSRGSSSRGDGELSPMLDLRSESQASVSSEDESQGGVMEPEFSAEAPQLAAEEPQLDAEAPQIDAEEPQTDAEAPQIDAEAPQFEAEETQIDAEESQLADEESQLADEEPQIDAEEPQLAAEEPQLDAEAPQIDAEEPQLDAEEPQLDPEEPQSALTMLVEDVPKLDDSDFQAMQNSENSAPEGSAKALTPKAEIDSLDSLEMDAFTEPQNSEQPTSGELTLMSSEFESLSSPNETDVGLGEDVFAMLQDSPPPTNEQRSKNKDTSQKNNKNKIEGSLLDDLPVDGGSPEMFDKVFVRQPKMKPYRREHAKYCCSACSKEFFTKEQVEACFFSHPEEGSEEEQLLLEKIAKLKNKSAA